VAANRAIFTAESHAQRHSISCTVSSLLLPFRRAQSF
jgi:hypothetical protein